MELIILAVTLILFLLFWRQRKPPGFPPGPPRLPLVGSLPFMAGVDPTTYHSFYRLGESYGPICGFYTPASEPVVILSDLTMIQQVFRLEATASRPPLPMFGQWRYGDPDGNNIKGILFGSGDSWREQRRFALKNLKDFGFGRASMEAMIQHEVGKLVDSLRHEVDTPTALDAKLNISIVSALWVILVGEELSLTDKTLTAVVESVSSTVQGPGLGRLAQLLVAVFPFLPRLVPAVFQPGQRQQAKTMIANIKRLVAGPRQEHRQTLEDGNSMRDFLDVHIAEQRAAKPGSSFHGLQGEQHEEVNLIDLFLAGTETTSTTITWGLLYLLHHPAVLVSLHEELDRVVGRDRQPRLEDEPKLPYTGAVLQEIQRCASIVYAGSPHYTTEEVAVGGYVIPRGCRVFANLLRVMHNPQVFPDPETFNPSRFLDDAGQLVKSSHVIPFLVGKRVCLGASLAEKELFLFLTTLLHTFNLEPVPGETLPSYNVRSRVNATPNGGIRFCPPYRLILRERK